MYEYNQQCFSVKILDYYNITVHSLVCNKLSESIMHCATVKISAVYSSLSIHILTSWQFNHGPNCSLVLMSQRKTITPPTIAEPCLFY